MTNITNKLNHLSYLQQRINYAERSFQDPVYFVENFPQRATSTLPVKNYAKQALSYCPSQGIQELLGSICDREYQRYGLIRATIHIPTSAMLADGITKVGKFAQLLRYSTTGRIVWGDLQGKNFRIGCLAQRASAPEEDLEANLPDQLE